MNILSIILCIELRLHLINKIFTMIYKKFVFKYLKGKP